MKRLVFAGFAGVSILVAGCAGGFGPAQVAAGDAPAADPNAAAAPSAADQAKAAGYDLKSDAGVRIKAGNSDIVAEKAKIVAMGAAGSRKDPFALLNAERRYEKYQSAERIMSDLGGFTVMFEPPEPVDTTAPVPQLDPVPAGTRLAGVIMHNGVAALLEWNGKVIEVRPGTPIPNSDWYVYSIDGEKAVLRRRSNKMPRQAIVPLASGSSIRESESNGGGAGGGTKSGGPPSRPGAAGQAGGGSASSSD